MAGLVPAISIRRAPCALSGMRGSSPRMTTESVETTNSRNAVPSQHLAHSVHEFLLRHRELRRAALAPFLIRCDRSGGFSAFNQIFDLHFAALVLIAALDNHAGR